MRACHVPWMILTFLFLGSARAEEGFVPIFDGKTLDGWEAVPKDSAKDWSVEEGVLVGRGSANRLVYLVWKEKDLTDFELRFQYRLRTKGNTGVEIRCRPDPSGRRPFVGYHADLGHVGIGENVLGAWDFHFARGTRREHPCPRGKDLTIDANDKASHRPIEDAVTLKDIRKQDWNEARIVARGNRFEFHINGKPASHFTDEMKTGRLKRGAIGLQLHDKGMVVEFRNPRLKKLVGKPESEGDEDRR